MTNETTASQPMQELVRDLYNFEGGRHFALRLEKMLTSQPKSIGDDVKFLRLMYEWSNAKGVKRIAASEALTAYIDNFRAAAAQASATIQAAPDHMGIECHYYDISPARKAFYEGVHAVGARLEAIAKGWDGCNAHGIDSGKGADIGADLRKSFASIGVATIQEPVMVAEPVDKQVAFLRGLCRAYGPKSLQYDIEHPCDGLNSADPVEVLRVQRGQVAAPMVADPAGVAVGEVRSDIERCSVVWYGSKPAHGTVLFSATVKAVPSDLTTMDCPPCNGKGLIGGHSGQTPESYEEHVEDCEECHGQGKIIVGAEDVKAVPSEALKVAAYRVTSPNTGKERLMKKSMAKVWDRSGYIVTPLYEIAAPLADKTGGGE